MTNPPEGSEQGSGPGPEHGYPSQPVQPPYGWQQPPPYGQQPSYGHQALYGGQQPYGAQPPSYGQQQPQYGQPPQYVQPGPYAHPAYGPYGPQYVQPRKKSQTGLIVGLVVLALAIVAAAVLIPTALSYKVLDPSAVQRDVAAQFQQRDGVRISLSCPQRMKVTSGAAYQCTGTTAQGDKVTLTIRIVDESTAAYTWSER